MKFLPIKKMAKIEFFILKTKFLFWSSSTPHCSSAYVVYILSHGVLLFKPTRI